MNVCEPWKEGYVNWTEGRNDCNDADSSIHPDATEVCNSVDDDCDGEVDEGDAARVAIYFDRDSDGHGMYDVHSTFYICPDDTLPAGYVYSDDDCDDSDSKNFPGNPERCDFADNDCDGLVEIEETSLYGTVIGFEDPDHDGYSSWPGSSGANCSMGRTTLVGTDYVGLLGDCDDSDADIFPAATEISDGVDNDCDGMIDE